MARKPTGRPNGRPKKVIDWQKLEFGCQIQATKEEICRWLNVSEQTLEKCIRVQYGEGFLTIHKKLSVDGIISLRRMQFKKAQEGNITMLIWLGKQYLGQSEKHELSGPEGMPVIPQEHTLNVSNKDIQEAISHLANSGAIRMGESPAV